MKGRRVIVFLLLACSVGLFAKPKSKVVMTHEQEEQFLYYFYAARHAIEQDDYPRALVLLDFCNQINPNDPMVNDHLGVLYSSLRQEEAAGKFFAKAFAAAPAECNEHYLDYLIHHEEWKKALKVQDQVDALNGFDSNSALNRYRIYVGLKKGKQAVAVIDRYLEQDPESLNFLLFRAEIHVQMGEDKEVFNLSQRIAKLMPLSLPEMGMVKNVPYCAYYVSLIETYEGDSLVSVGQFNAAWQAYEIAIYLWPKNLTALNNYAYCLAIHGGDLSQAEKMSATTIQTDADNAVYLDTYAWILHLKGQDSLAMFYLRKALENAREPEVKAVVEEHMRELKGEK